MADLAAQYAAQKAEIDAAVQGVLASGAFILGSQVSDFEAAVARYCDARHGIGVGNGTDALLLSLLTLGVGPGDEVITPPFTFVATVETVALLGAVPVFADIDPATFTLSPTETARKISPRTRAIVPVHLFGQLADMRALGKIAADHGVPILADGAQAIGSRQDGVGVAASAALTTLSFYPTKNLGGAGDGGMVLTDSDELAERLRLLRFHGSRGTYDYKEIGVCSRLDAIQAALLAVKLQRLDGWNEARRANAAFYSDALRGVDGLTLPAVSANNVHTFHQFTVRVHGGRRDALKAFLAERGVASGIFYPIPLHLAPAYRSRFGGAPGDYPESERACAEVLSLPIYPELGADARAYVAQSVQEFFAQP